MANHKRNGPSTRSGCLMYKPHKHQAEHRRDRTRDERRWREEEAAASDEVAPPALATLTRQASARRPE